MQEEREPAHLGVSSAGVQLNTGRVLEACDVLPLLQPYVLQDKRKEDVQKVSNTVVCQFSGTHRHLFPEKWYT